MESNLGTTSCPEDQAEQWRSEAIERLIGQIESRRGAMSVADSDFFEKIKGGFIVPQLFWLRRLRDRYVP